MKDALNIVMEAVPSQERANELMKRIFDVAHTRAVFSDPVTQGEYTVINAAEVSVGLGYGYGGGGGWGNETEETTEDAAPGASVGGGGGGGGGSMARPVAVIEIGPNGVRVEPVVDVTKIALAFFTAFGSMFMMLGKMKRLAEEK